jgi:hypothetical protein
MNYLRTVLYLTAVLCLLIGTADAQVDFFARSAIIAPPVDSVSWGHAVAGVDFDGDGKTEIYAVNNNWNDWDVEMTPRIYKYEYNSTSGAWEVVWEAAMSGILGQNTWPALTYGDWDKDGKKEIIWGPVNNFVAGNEIPYRIIVFETPGDGSDNMGVSDGSGGWKPNAAWVIDSTASYNLRPFRWLLHDIDGDSDLELLFCDRASSTGGSGYKVGVVSVSTIPDNGDGSEVWTLEASGKGMPTAGSSAYDIVAVDSTAYVFHATTSGNVTRVRFRDGSYIVDVDSTKITPLSASNVSGGFKTAQVVDINGDGTKEIVGAGYSGASTNDIWLLTITDGGDSLHAFTLYDPNTTEVGASSRFVASDFGDIDGDGNIDIVFGSRDGSAPGDVILRMEYKGSGDITDGASYDWTILDKGFGTGGERIDIVSIGNLDADADLEVITSSAAPTNNDFPLLLTDRITLPMAATPIATVRTDTDGNGVPNDSGSVVYVMGTVNSVNFGGSYSGSYYIDDGTAAINIYMNTSTRPDLAIGDRIWVKGTLASYAGLDEVITTTDSATLVTDVVNLGPAYKNIVTPITLTLEQYLANPEPYESRLLKITGIAKKAGQTTTWPGPTSSSTNLTFWDGYAQFTLRIDSDTDIRGTTEPTYPVDVVGIGNQYDSSEPRNSGYQIFPRMRTDFTEGVAVRPNPHFDLVLPADNSTITLSDGFVQPFAWNAAVDLNGDNLQYQWIPIGGTAVGGTDTFLVRTGEELKALLGAADTVLLKWTVLAKDAGAAVANVDTFTVTIIRGTITGVAENEIPTDFGLSQNFPNPFNPTTTIEYALPTAANVTLRVYNMLGQEIASLVNETRPAGFMQVVWNGRDSRGAQVASGTYLYRIEARAVDGSQVFVQNRKMILLK